MISEIWMSDDNSPKKIEDQFKNVHYQPSEMDQSQIIEQNLNEMFGNQMEKLLDRSNLNDERKMTVL